MDHRSHLSELFEPGKELVCFETREDLREKIRYYLSHPDERMRIALNGQKRAREDHTYQKRMSQALEWVVGRNVDRFKTLKERVQTPARLIGEAGAETELGRFLGRFENEESLTLDRIVSEIHQGEGKLTDPELVFLLMHELSESRGSQN